MNREIKFRLRIAERINSVETRDKIAGYEKWYSGHWDEATLSWTARPCWLYSVDGKIWNPKYIWHQFKDQFTGLEDINHADKWPGGQPIYENDIIQLYNTLREKLEICRVIYRDGEFWIDTGWYAFGMSGLTDPQTSNRLAEVIGNKWENPELLK